MRKKQETPRLVSFGYGFSTLLPTCSAISDNFATAQSFTSIKDCERVKETFHVPKPLTPSIGTSAAWEGRRELSERPSQFSLGKLSKYFYCSVLISLEPDREVEQHCQPNPTTYLIRKTTLQSFSPWSSVDPPSMKSSFDGDCHPLERRGRAIAIGYATSSFLGATMTRRDSLPLERSADVSDRTKDFWPDTEEHF